VQMNGKWLAVPAGSLNGAALIKPDAHIFVSSRADWDDALEKVPTFARFPT